MYMKAVGFLPPCPLRRQLRGCDFKILPEHEFEKGMLMLTRETYEELHAAQMAHTSMLQQGASWMNRRLSSDFPPVRRSIFSPRAKSIKSRFPLSDISVSATVEEDLREEADEFQPSSQDCVNATPSTMAVQANERIVSSDTDHIEIATEQRDAKSEQQSGQACPKAPSLKATSFSQSLSSAKHVASSRAVSTSRNVSSCKQELVEEPVTAAPTNAIGITGDNKPHRSGRRD
ncbi:MAG: hypothetical protein SGPRY_009120, partial [Prymnesium sp.]